MSNNFIETTLNKCLSERYLGHLLSSELSLSLSLHHSFVHVSHPTRFEQARQTIRDGWAGVCWHIEHWKASSKDAMKDRLKLCLKASWRYFEISFFTSVSWFNHFIDYIIIRFVSLAFYSNWLLLFCRCNSSSGTANNFILSTLENSRP